MLRLEQLRKENNLSQEGLARKLNMTQQRISAYEKGKREPDLETLKQLSNFFGVSTDYILGNSDERNTVDVSKVQFANNGGLDTTGLDDDEVEELKKQVEYMRWKKQNKEGK